jgi:hypothetical protein
LIGNSSNVIRLALGKVDLCLGDRNNAGVTNNINIHASRVNFLLAIWKPKSAWHSGPIPHPIECVGLTRGDVSWKLDILLAPKIIAHHHIKRMIELLLSLLGDWTTVGLVALTIVEVAGGKKATTTVTTRTIRSPHTVDGEERVVRAGLTGAVDVDCATILWLAGLVVWQGHMAILLKSQRNSVPRSRLQSGRTIRLGLRSLG